MPSIDPSRQTDGVRPLEAADALHYRALMLTGYRLAADAFTSTVAEREAEPIAWWVSRLCDPRGMSRCFGVFHSGELVGGVAIEYSARQKTRHKAHVVGMYVSPAARGRGAGRSLLAAAVMHARERPGVTVLTLTVTEGNRPAIGLYESAGFRSFGIEPMAIFTGSDYKAKVHMALALDRQDRLFNTAPTRTSV